MAKRKRTRKKKLQKQFQNAGLAMILLLLGLLLLWPYLRSAFLTVFVPVGRGTPGVLDEKTSGYAIYADGQTVLTAPVAGSIKFFVSDGDPVRVGDVIAEIGDEDALGAVRESLLLAEDDLRLYEEKTEGEFLTLTGSLQDCYQRAVSTFFRMQIAHAAGDIPGLIDTEDDFSVQARALSDNRAKLKGIEDERSRLSKRVEVLRKVTASSSVKILSPVSGTFFSQLVSLDPDICSSYLSEKDASELTVLAKDLAGARTYRVETGQEVAQGDLIGRIVSGEDVRFFLTVKTEQRADVRTGDRVLIELEDKTSLGAAITGVVDGKPPGYSIISGKISYVSPDDYVRTSYTSLITRRKQGVIIPVKSLIEKDGQSGVLVVQKTYARFCTVDILMVKGDQAVVSGINEATEIVLKGMGFFEGRRVR
ncbi:MAG TPA: hypothetical protein GX524_07375 [Firmicutes bacterium]|nr:hypothetical protein [Bacillota bacterium]